MQRPRSNPLVVRAAAVMSAVLLVALPLTTESAFGSVVPPEAQAAAVTGSPAAPRQLHVVILDGEGALNNIKERTAREPIVQIQDENHKPVSEAAVLFLIQGNGSGAAGGTFANGLTSFSVTTGADGVAKAPGLTPNGTAGAFTIVVTATVAGITATSLIHQTNAIGGTHLGKILHQTSVAHPHLIVAGSIVAGAAVVATVAVVATQTSGSTTIATGASSVGAPPVTSFTLHFGKRR